MTQNALPLNLPAATPQRTDAVHFQAPLAGPTHYTTLDSPLGQLLLHGDGEALTGVKTPPQNGTHSIPENWIANHKVFTDIGKQLTAYFNGGLRSFDLLLAPTGTAWQLQVWRALTTIPYGETASYGELAEELGKPTASRAVGTANGRNPISIIVPCHRVIGANGSLTGYAGGLDRKKYLLNLEKHPQNKRATSAPAATTFQ
ncbi:methylated-DNA--[protein]-cysteine S-methyltransferase [Nocardiopsis oceani]